MKAEKTRKKAFCWYWNFSILMFYRDKIFRGNLDK